MTLGVPGTGPYGAIRSLQEEINSLKYKLELIALGVKSKRGSIQLHEAIKANGAKIREIKAAEKARKLAP